MIARRKFLKALGVLPFLRHLPALPVPVADEECPGCTGDPAEHPTPTSPVLGAAMGEPTAVSVVTHGQVLKIIASAHLIDGGSVMIKEDATIVGYYQSGPGELVAEAIVHPPAGLHTYRMVATGPVYDHAVSRPYIMVRTL